MIPNFNFTKIADKDGNLTGEAQMFFQQLTDVLQKNFSTEGYVVPKQPAANVTVLDNEKSTNSLIVNSDTNELLFNQNGTYKTVQLV